MKSATSAFASVKSVTELKAVAATFETALTPYLQARAAHIKIQASLYKPSQADLFTIAKRWNLLSTSFKTLYLQAMEFPPNLKVYTSPGGHYDILYSTTGIDSVDITDTIGYNTSDWRTKTHTANGIPDYIDAVAFSADSAWSMEVDHFGFLQPIAYAEPNYNSTRHKIWVHELDSAYGVGYYGLTTPMPDNQDTLGFPSYIEIRSEWSDPDYWVINASLGLDYTKYPEKAVNVTCAHENFHTIQYAMVRQLNNNVWMDDFPISWTEGCAVLMEHACFDYVKDYTQYLTMFFDYPLNPMLDLSYDGLTEYKNALITIYLYEIATGSQRIDFVKGMDFANYAQTRPFLDNLRKTSLKFGRTWADIMGSFFTQSYYTGARAVSGRFVSDAAILGGEWQDSIDASITITKSVAPFGMNTFYYSRISGDTNTLTIRFLGVADNTDTNTIWNVNCILQKDGFPAHDSLCNIPVTSASGTLTVPAWPNFQHVLVVATNAKNDIARNATVAFITPFPDSAHYPATFTAYPNPCRIRNNGAITFLGQNILELWIYAMDGSLVGHCVKGNAGSLKSFSETTYKLVWHLCTNNGTTISPGVYYAQVGFKDQVTKGMKKQAQKIFVMP